MNFDGTNITSQGVVNTGTFDWTNVRGAVMVGRTLYYGMTDNLLYKRSFDGVNFGARRPGRPVPRPALGDASRPVAVRTVRRTTACCPTWYSQLSGVTGMFYANGKLYYTRSGQTSLFWSWFSPDSGAVNPTDNTVAGGNITWASTKGMFLDGNTLYVVNSTNGQLLKIRFVNGAPSGTSTRGQQHDRLARQGTVPGLGAAERATVGGLHLRLHRHRLHLRRHQLERLRRQRPVVRVDVQRR